VGFLCPLLRSLCPGSNYNRLLESVRIVEQFSRVPSYHVGYIGYPVGYPPVYVTDVTAA
jgi:hypothetical protein